MSDAPLDEARLRLRALAMGKSQPARASESCPATNAAGNSCKMRPMASGYCMAHDPARAQERQAERRRGGSLRAAHEALAREKAELVARYGLEGDLPSLESVEALGAYLSTVAARVEARQLTPAQGNTLVSVVKMAKDLLGLSLDIKLAEQLDALESR
jgi:hypothetical protein